MYFEHILAIFLTTVAASGAPVVLSTEALHSHVESFNKHHTRFVRFRDFRGWYSCFPDERTPIRLQSRNAMAERIVGIEMACGFSVHPGAT